MTMLIWEDDEYRGYMIRLKLSALATIHEAEVRHKDHMHYESEVIRALTRED